MGAICGIHTRETTLGCDGGDLTSVDLKLAAWFTNSDDVALLLENLDGLSGERSVDSDSLRDDGRGDELGLGDLLVQLVPQDLVEHDGVVNLILLLALGPLLLLSLTTGKGGLNLCLL